MTTATPFTLPVWVAAAARAGLEVLLEAEGIPAAGASSGVSREVQPLELLEPPGVELVPVEAAASLGDGQALGMARCDPGDGLDLTRGLLVWVRASWWDPPQGAEPPQRLRLEAGRDWGSWPPPGRCAFPPMPAACWRSTFCPWSQPAVDCSSSWSSPGGGSWPSAPATKPSGWWRAWP